MDMKTLAERALDALKYAYVPYSGYSVGAALLTKSRKIYTGCNIENAAYSPTLCAERTAMAKAISEGEREFAAIAVASGKNGVAGDPFPPCGVCRQFMREFCDDDFSVLLVSPKGEYKEYKLSQLLPFGFSNRNLTKM